jgi:survival of motor neuron-related-splicing factor 30
MSANDLETYQAQLEQVEQVLKTDRDNEELKSLVTELKELISLTEEAIAAANPQPKVSASSSSNNTPSAGASGSSTPVPKKSAPNNGASRGPQHVQNGNAQNAWAAGDECLAKYSGDDKWYPARITSVGGSEEKRVYSVVFKGYNSTELVASNAIKRLPPSYQHQHQHADSLPSAGQKRKLSKEEEEDRERKKKRNEKKLEVRAAKSAEQDSKKASWQKFATKSVKKGVGIAGVAGTSIFKTPENPLGKGEMCQNLMRLRRY